MEPTYCHRAPSHPSFLIVPLAHTPATRPRVGRFLLSKVPVFTLNTYLRHCIGMYRACIGMYRGARPKSLCDDTIPVDTREIHHDTTYRTPAPSPPDPIHRYTLDTIQIQSIYMYLASRPLLAAASDALARPPWPDSTPWPVPSTKIRRWRPPQPAPAPTQADAEADEVEDSDED